MFLFISAIIPVIFLCYFIYVKDINREPFKFLLKIFGLGFLSAIPVVIVELILGSIFPAESVNSFIHIFINTFISVALVEEGFKWIIIRLIAYNNKEFDEVYDIIVYSVFASLGFACIENILYVITGGFTVAILRALLSIPGHTCFGIVMGYFFAQEKLATVNKNLKIKNKNIILSLVVPSLLHSIYDSLLFYVSNNNSYSSLGVFFLFDITMVVFCFIIVGKMSKIQQKLISNVSCGSVVADSKGFIHYEGELKEINYCPVCGTYAKGYNYCKSCGCKLK